MGGMGGAAGAAGAGRGRGRGRRRRWIQNKQNVFSKHKSSPVFILNSLINRVNVRNVVQKKNIRYC